MLLRSTFNKFHIQHLTAPRLAVRLCSATMPYSVPVDLARQIRNNASSIPDVQKKPVPKQVGLPKGFLDGPASNVIRSRVDFTKGGLPEYEGAWAVVLDGVLSQEECDTIVAAAEETTNGTWERAMVNIGGGFQALYEDTRKCGRIMWDNKELAEKLLQRIDKEVLSEIDRLEKWSVVTGYGPFKRNEVWKMTRLNERLRFLKYTGGEYFKGEQTEWWGRRCIANKKKAHCDGAYETPDRKERSYFTLQLYLKDSEGKDGEEPLEGGATTFYSPNMKRHMDVVPKAGRVLLFQHRDLIHSGDDVVSGTKLTLRTDIMYTKEEK